jgi:hypothetical protein
MEGPYRLEVRAFALGDQAGPSAVLVELRKSIADQGISGTYWELWRCTDAGCTAISVQ